MQKFTIFSALLTIIVIIVVAQIVVSDYLPNYKNNGENSVLDVFVPDSFDLSESTQSNVLGGTNLTNKLGPDNSEDIDESEMLIKDETVTEEIEIPTLSYSPPEVIDETSTNNEELDDFEDFTYSALSATVFLNDEQIKKAGFVNAYKENEAHDGYLYKTVYIDDLPDVSFTKYVIRDQSRLFAKVYVISPESSTSNAVYKSIKARAEASLNSSVNQTDEYGDGSFYLNDSTRSSIAFLTVKIGPSIYGFSYPKEYHPQIKNLISSMELSR
ncbi:hypothetical protein GF354_06535 [Candidatus Peregrinibacteria bacterium]|nr:hypothetical protein [Candidatus Peregrinibacteria bacterium]